MNTKKHLTKSENKKLFGVIGGFSEYYDWDPTWARIIFIVFVLATGFFPLVVVYFAAALVMDKPEGLPIIR